MVKHLTIEELREKIREDLKNEVYHESEFKEYIELLVFSLIKEESFFANFIIQLNRIIKIDLKAPAAVNIQRNSVNLFLNPFKLMNYTTEEIKAILIHEIYHIVNIHIPRYEGLKNKYPHYYANVAMDAAINQFIDNLPKGTVTVKSIEEMFNLEHLELKREFEYYLEKMMKSERGKKWEDLLNQIKNGLTHECPDCGGNGKSSDEEGQSGDGTDEEDKDDSETSSDDKESNDSSSGSNGNDEECPTCSKNGLMEPKGNGMGNHDIWDSSEFFGGQEEMKELISELIRNAASKSRGTIPSNIQRILADLNKKSEISWQNELKKMMGTIKIPFKRTMLRRSRRMPERTDIRGRMSDRTINIKIALDTSGSQGAEQLAFAFNEISHILKNVNYKVEVIECDAKVQHSYYMNDIRKANVKPHGGGGTRFSPVIEYLNKQKGMHKADLLVYFTDGWGEPQLTVEPRGYRVLWVLKDGADKISLNPPHGKVKNLNYKK